MEEEKRSLNLNAPLLSVRRHHNGSPENVTMKSVRDPGVVPFRWETVPGRPNATTWHCQQPHSPPANIGGTLMLALKASSFRILNPAADENILEVACKEKLSTKTYSTAYGNNSQSLNGVSPCQDVRVQSVCDNENGSADTPTSKSKILVDVGDNCNEMSAEGLRSERDLIEEVYVPNKAPDIPELVTSNLATTDQERSPSNPTMKSDLEDEPTEDISCNDPEARRLEDGGKNNGNPQFLLPLALPKSPTESWLWRALPLVSEKNLSFRASLGVRFNSKNKPIWTPSSAVSKSETTKTTSEVPGRKMRLSEILAMPISED